MKFTKVEQALALCKKHLDETGARNTLIENHLAAYLLVLISAEFEVRVKALIEARAARSDDKHLKNFVKHATTKLVRGPKIHEITGLLGGFDNKFPETFHDKVGDRSKAAYDKRVFLNSISCPVCPNDDGFSTENGLFS